MSSDPDRPALAEALRAVRSTLTPTPLLASEVVTGAMLKLETAQPTGSFKVRGALAAMSMTPQDEHIVTASTGNHGLAVAWAAQRTGRSATVVLPESASPAKAGRLSRFPAELIRHGDNIIEAEAYAREHRAGDARFLSAYNDLRVIAGQATIGAELEVIDEPMTVVCPVGGGGLLAGLCAWAKNRPEVTLIGVEPEASRAMSAAVEAGRTVPVGVGPTLADGVAGNIQEGAITVELVRRRVDGFAAVTEAQIRAAIHSLIKSAGLVAEGAAALGYAALLAGLVPVRGRAVALITGRNITTALLGSVLTEYEAEHRGHA